MCGFFGLIYGTMRPNIKELEAAALKVAYRGRDENGVYQDEHCYLAHYRLSIIDLNTGQQPMTDFTKRYVILFNGELYNYIELRKELELAGHRFSTESDTEVFLAGVTSIGANFLKKAEGMFAAAIWDKLSLTLTLVRDPLGKKPLYIWEAPDGGIAVASSIASFKALSGWQGELNKAAIIEFISSATIPAPISIYSKVRKVMPASIEKFSHKSSWTGEIYDFIDFRRPKKNIGENDILHDLSRALSWRLRADVPLGMTFSGGVDSGLLACLMKDLKHKPTLFNIDYESVNNKSPERRNARIAASRLSFDLVEENFIPESIFTGLPETYRYYDEPCSQPTLVYSYQILKIIRRHGIKAIITGNGGDELFFGYRGNKRIRLISDLLRLVLPIIPADIFPARIRILKKEGWTNCLIFHRYEKIKRLAKELNWDISTILGSDKGYIDSYRNSLDLAKFSRFSDYFLWQGLRSAGDSNYILPDIGGMQAQVEVRSPFLDWNFVKYVATIPEELRVGSYFSDRQNKAVLKSLYAKQLGRDLAYEKKRGMGWNIRWDIWIIHEPQLRQFFEDTLNLLAKYNIAPDWFLENFRRYCAADKFNGPGIGESIRGFMLALWLKKEIEGETALENWLDPTRGFEPCSGRSYE